MDLSFGRPAMQAITARLVRSLSIGQRTSPEQERQDHQTQSSQPEAHPPGFSSTLHDANPGLSVDVSDAPDHASFAKESDSSTDAHLVPLPESPLEWPTTESAMHPSHEAPDGSPTIASSNSLPSSQAGQVHPTETDATPAYEDSPARSLASSKESCKSKNQIHVQQKLGKDRMTVMGLRSDAQEQGKALMRLYNQFRDDTSLVLAFLKKNVLGQEVGTGPVPSIEHVDGILALMDSIEEARKVFHKSQERLLVVEWRMKEEEDQFYSQYGGRQSPSLTVDDSGESLSDLASIPLPASSEEDQLVAAFPGQTTQSIQYGAPFFRASELNVEYELMDALVEPGLFSSTTLRNEYNEPIHRPPNEWFDNKSLNLKHADAEDISPPLRSANDQSMQALAASGHILRHSRTPLGELGSRQYGDKQNPEELSYLGTWFTNDSRNMSSAKHDPTEEILRAQEYAPTSAYSISGMLERSTHRLPWSLFTAGSRDRPDRLPGDVNSFQGITIENYESVILGLPVSETFNHIRVLVNRDVRATRSFPLHDWLFEFNADNSFEYASDMVPVVHQADPQTQRVEFEMSILSTSEESPDPAEVKGVNSEPIIARNTNTTYTINTVRSDSVLPRHSLTARSLRNKRIT